MSEYKCWDQRLEEAKEGGSFTDDDRKNADLWSSCSVGEQRKMLGSEIIRCKSPLTVCPEDTFLEKLGLDFASAVRLDEVEAAISIHGLICEHASILKARYYNECK